MLRRLLRCTFAFFSLCVAGLSSGHQCPDLQSICKCSANPSEISITCSKGKSLEEILDTLSAIQTPLDELIISNTPINEIPDFAFRNLSTRKLFLKGNAITTIHANAFMGPLLDSLQVLDISDNKLRTVTQPGMPVLRNLHILNLCNNSIASLPPNAFLNYQSRFSLRELDLSANQLSRIPNHTFSGLEMLQTLAVTKNLLKIIPTDALKALPTLENLLLSVNEIKSIPANALPLPKLKSISFEANLISEISVDAFRQNPQLSSLYLNDNQLSCIAPTVFQAISQLRILNMGSNKLLTTISNKTFGNLERLFRLDLSDCSIHKIENGAFQRLHQLQIISLGGNRLKQIDQIFAGLRHLTTIDLSDNEINEVKNFAFSNFPFLNHLDLSRNQLTTLPESAFQGTLEATWPPTTRDFYLYSNPWNCNQGLKWLQKRLTENGNVHTSIPGNERASCQEPPNLRGKDIGNVNLSRSNLAKSLSSGTNLNEKANPINNFDWQAKWWKTHQPFVPVISTSFANLIPDENMSKRKTEPYPPIRKLAGANEMPYASMPFIKSSTDAVKEQVYADEAKGQAKATTIMIVILTVLSCVAICAIMLLVMWYLMKRRSRSGNKTEHDICNSTISGVCSTYGFDVFNDAWFQREYGCRKTAKGFWKKTWEKWF